ncbi:MAG: nitrogenase component 1 [Phascolarctobacterium sp.]
MGLKEDAMWAMARKMGMPESAIAKVKSKQGAGGMPNMQKMLQAMLQPEKKQEMLRVAQRMGMPPLAKGMDGQELLGKLKRLSQVQTIKEIPQLTKALFPGTHCPLMGAAMTAGGIKDCLLVIVGTDECSYYTKSMTINQRFGGIGGRCVSIVLDGHDVTFGSAETLHRSFDELVQEYKPACVMLVTTCVIEVIGDDYDALAQELSAKYGIPVLPVHTEHFKCEDHFPGLERAISACLELMKPMPANNSVNVLGQRMGDFASTELYRMLRQAGVQVGLQLPSGCTVADIRKAAAAKVNIVVHDIALPLAQTMEKKFGIPYVYFNKFCCPEKIMASYEQLFKYLELELPSELGELYAKSKEFETAAKAKLKGTPYIYGNTPYDCFEMNSYMCSLGLVPQLIQSNKFLENNPEVAAILQYADPYICKAANIAPLQYVYDVLQPYLYLGHEFDDRLRAKGIAVVHSDAAGAMLGFEVQAFLLGVLLESLERAKQYRQEAGL